MYIICNPTSATSTTTLNYCTNMEILNINTFRNTNISS